MGYSSYSIDDRSTRATAGSYSTKTTAELFASSFNSVMSPFGVGIRESRDSENHPQSFPVIIALDVTGSMLRIPEYLVKEGLPNIVSNIIQKGFNDPQIMFIAIGDHECDSYPLQISQFESGDKELDYWLMNTYLEAGGGGNLGESYLLAWYFAANHTDTDSFVKRGRKGLLITIGDEPCLQNIPGSVLKNIFGENQYARNNSAFELYQKANEKWNCFHIHVRETNSGSRQHVMDGWKQMIGDNLIIVDRHNKISNRIIDLTLSLSGSSQSTNVTQETKEDEML